MSPILFDLMNLFVKSPGDFLYFLLMIVFSLVGLGMAYQLKTASGLQSVSQRYLTGFFVLFAGWLVFVVGAIYVSLAHQEPLLILPPMERVISVVAVVAIGWAMLTADHESRRRAANITALVLAGIAFIGYLLTASSWAGVYQGGLSDFNLRYSAGWSVGLAIVSLVGIAGVIGLFRSVMDAPLKLVFFVLILLGALYQASSGQIIGSYPGAVRLAFVLAMVIPLVVLYRLQNLQSLTLRERLRDVQSRLDTAARPTARPVAIDSQSNLLMRTMGRILENSTPANLPEQIIRATLDTGHLDVAFLLRVQDANYADIVYAYDKVIQRTPSAISLNLNNQPTLTNVIERRMPRTLYVDRNRDELEDLFTRLDIDRIGTVYFYPLLKDNDLKAVLGVGLPYTERELDANSEELVKSISILATHLLALSDAAAETTYLAEDRAIQAMVEGVALSNVPADAAVVARQEMQSALQLAREQIAELSKQVMTLTLRLGDERNRLAGLLGNDADALSASQALTAITDEQQRLRQERDTLALKVKEAETTLTSATAGSDQGVVDQMVALLERDKQKLMRERDRLQAQLNELQVQGNLMLPEYMQQIIARMQEEQTRLEQDRSQLADQLTLMQGKMQALGLETTAEGMSPLIAQLVEERATLSQRVESLQHDKDLLLAERARVSGSITRTRETDARTAQLEGNLENLAQDREVAIKQRDRVRAEYEDLKRKLDIVKEHRARLLAQVSGYELELNDAREDQTRLRLQIHELADARSNLMHLRDKLTAENQGLQAERDEGIAHSLGDTERVQAIAAESTIRLQEMVNDLSSARHQLEQELNEARSQLIQTGRTPEQLNAGVMSVAANYDPNNPELFMGMVQELRTPLTSLIGYVDLLLNESAGILGEMQRKFLQRVSANVVRLQTMIEELVQIANLDTGTYKLEPMPVSVVSLIEDAITNASVQFREKSLRVSLDLDDGMPLLSADKDSLTQIIVQLLTNAYLVSPPNAQITVSAHPQTMALNAGVLPVPVIVVSVEDRGGGVQPEDIPRVFSRKYKAENPLIAGLGDTGVGMSIAKTLAEAHGGQLWVETRPNVGSIFSFVLPLTQVTENLG